MASRPCRVPSCSACGGSREIARSGRPRHRPCWQAALTLLSGRSDAPAPGSNRDTASAGEIGPVLLWHHPPHRLSGLRDPGLVGVDAAQRAGDPAFRMNLPVSGDPGWKGRGRSDRAARDPSDRAALGGAPPGGRPHPGHDTNRLADPRQSGGGVHALPRPPTSSRSCSSLHWRTDWGTPAWGNQSRDNLDRIGRVRSLVIRSSGVFLRIALRQPHPPACRAWDQLFIAVRLSRGSIRRRRCFLGCLGRPWRPPRYSISSCRCGPGSSGRRWSTATRRPWAVSCTWPSGRSSRKRVSGRRSRSERQGNASTTGHSRQSPDVRRCLVIRSSPGGDRDPTRHATLLTRCPACCHPCRFAESVHSAGPWRYQLGPALIVITWLAVLATEVVGLVGAARRYQAQTG